MDQGQEKALRKHVRMHAPKNRYGMIWAPMSDKMRRLAKGIRPMCFYVRIYLRI